MFSQPSLPFFAWISSKLWKWKINIWISEVNFEVWAEFRTFLSGASVAANIQNGRRRSTTCNRSYASDICWWSWSWCCRRKFQYQRWRKFMVRSWHILPFIGALKLHVLIFPGLRHSNPNWNNKLCQFTYQKSVGGDTWPKLVKKAHLYSWWKCLSSKPSMSLGNY